VSWDEGFADRYDEWAAHMTEDVAFYVGLARQADGPLVELAVGNGRVAIPVAQATGRPVTGIDSSPAMLAQARAGAAAAGVRLDLREGDMRDLALDEPAALIYCPFRALLHLPTWADRRRTFERVAAALRPGGRFAWEAFAFDHQLAVRYDGVHQTEPVPHTVRYAVGDNRVDLVRDDGARASAWWATKNEWLGLIDVAGLELEALYGGFAGEPFTEDSREYVFVTRAPGGLDLPGPSNGRDQSAWLTVPGLPFGNTADFEAADRGLVDVGDPVVRNEAGEVVWDNGSYRGFLTGDAPDTVHPSLWRQSTLVARQGLFEVTDGIYQVRGYDLSNLSVGPPQRANLRRRREPAGLAVRRPATRQPELQHHRALTGAALLGPGRGRAGNVFRWRMRFPAGPRPWARPRATGEPTSR
jgi:SAM-dependent methyltransferase